MYRFFKKFILLTIFSYFTFFSFHALGAVGGPADSRAHKDLSVKITNVASNSAAAPGNVANGSSTIDTTPTIYGEVGSAISSLYSVQIYADNSQTPLDGKFEKMSSIKWKFTPSTPLSVGNHALQAAIVKFDATVMKRSGKWNITMADSKIIEVKLSPSSEYENKRLITYDAADFVATGLSAKPGSRLEVFSASTGLYGNGKTTVLVGTIGIDSNVQTVDLNPGTNFINVQNGGLVYVRYVNDSPPFFTSSVKFTFLSGFSRVPHYILGINTLADWKKQLTQFAQAKHIVMESKRATLVYTMEKAMEWKNSDYDKILSTYDVIINAEDQISGLDNKSVVTESDKYLADLNRPRSNKYLVVEVDHDYLYSTNWRVAVNGKSMEAFGMSFTSDIMKDPWGISHELGHHHQQLNWRWESVAETTVNIYSLAAERALKISPNNLQKRDDWNLLVRPYLARDNTGKNFNDDTQIDIWIRLYMFHQLWLAYGDDFYSKLHKLVRKENVSNLTDTEKFSYFILTACKVSGSDLTDFFKQWGLIANARTLNLIKNLGLPKPIKDIATLHD